MALTITGSPIATAQVGVAYPGFYVSAQGGVWPYTFSYPMAGLPPGLEAYATGPATIYVGGTIRQAAQYVGCAIRVTDATGTQADLPLGMITATIEAPVTPEPPVAAQWWTPGVYHQSDPINGRYIVDGVEYASVAAMVVAGVATIVPGGIGYSVLLPPNTQVSVVADGVASSATPSAIEYLVGFDGTGAAATTDFFYIGRTTTNLTQSGITAAGVTVTTLALGAGTASTPVRVSGRWKSAGYVASRDGNNGVANSGAAYPTIGRVTIGNRYDGIRPWNGTINGVSVFITREFTKEQAELMSGVRLLRGLAWSWWNKQQWLTRNGKTYGVAYNYRDLRQYVVCLDEASGKCIDFFPLTTANEIPLDDHSTGGVEFTSVGELMVVNVGHDNQAWVNFRRSANDMPGNMGANIQIPLEYASTASYAQMYVNGNDVWVLTQSRGNRYWYPFQSSNKGDTWTKRKALFVGVDPGNPSPAQDYIAGSDVNAGVVTLYHQFHPGNLQNPIRRFAWNLITGVISAAGTPLGSVFDANLDVAIASSTAFEVVRVPAANNSQRLLDVRGDGQAILIATTADAWVNANIYYGNTPTAGGFSFNLVTNTNSFSPTNNPSYVEGACFAREVTANPRIYTGRISGGNNLIEQQDTTDTVTWTPTVLRNTAATKSMRPTAPRGATTALAILSQTGTHTDFNNWVIDAYASAAA